MKINDCECGGIPHVTYNIEGENLFKVSCPICGTATPEYENLTEAIRIWNVWCRKKEYWLTEDATV